MPVGCVVLSVIVHSLVDGLDCCSYVFLFQAEDGIRDLVRSRGLGDVYKRQPHIGEPGAQLRGVWGGEAAGGGGATGGWQLPGDVVWAFHADGARRPAVPHALAGAILKPARCAGGRTG